MKYIAIFITSTSQSKIYKLSFHRNLCPPGNLYNILNPHTIQKDNPQNNSLSLTSSMHLILYGHASSGNKMSSAFWSRVCTIRVQWSSKASLNTISTCIAPSNFTSCTLLSTSKMIKIFRQYKKPDQPSIPFYLLHCALSNKAFIGTVLLQPPVQLWNYIFCSCFSLVSAQKHFFQTVASQNTQNRPDFCDFQ